MRKILIVVSFLVGMSLKAQDRHDIMDCVQEFFDGLSELNQIMPGETEGTDKARHLQRTYQGEFFDFNDRHDVRLIEFLTYYKNHVLGNASVYHDVLDLNSTLTTEGTQSYRLSDVRIHRMFDWQDSMAISQPYSDTITCNMLVTWMGEEANPRIRINGISYTEPLEKTPQMIAIRRTPILKVSNANASVSAYSGSHRVSVFSYCDIESIYTNGKSVVRRDTLPFIVIGNRYEVKNNEVKFYYSSNPNRKERKLSWTIEQNETGETCEVMVRQEKRKIEIGLFDYDVDNRGTFSANLYHIPNGIGLSYNAYFDESRFGIGLLVGFPIFHNPYNKTSIIYSSSTSIDLSDGTTAMVEAKTIDHTEVRSSPNIKVKNDFSFYSFIGLTCSFAINSYLDLEYSPMYLYANHRYDLKGSWVRTTTTRNNDGKKDIIVDYQELNSSDQSIWLYDDGKSGFMNRFGVRTFIPLGGDFSLNIGYGYNIHTIKGIPNYSDFSIGFGITL